MINVKENKKNHAIEITDNLKRDFSEYIKSTFDLRDPEYNKLFFEELIKNEKSLYKGPYITSSLAFKQGKSINQLIDDGLLNPDMKLLKRWNESTKVLEDFNCDRPLYWHQVETLKRIEAGNNVVVTTGTGSGKTESFLFPIINSILNEIHSSNNESGIRAIFLFPMNALVNDQMQRVREFLSSFPEIKYAIFNGETKENDPFGREKKALENELNGMPLPCNELYTREAIRKEKPHILFTNYSMLEYLLIRPDDRSLISDSAMKYWRFLVLDEAHTYKGALGIEISMLLSRLCGIAQKNPQFILTSATLGRGKEDINDIKAFASKLTRSNFENEDIIFSKRIVFDYDNMDYSLDPNDYSLLEGENDFGKVKDICSKYYNCENVTTINSLLYNLLIHDKNVLEFYRFTEKGCTLYELIGLLQNCNYKFNIENITSLINIVSSIETSDAHGLKFINVKYHLFVKAPDGCYVTLGNNKKLKLTVCNYIDDKKAFKIGICDSCKTSYIMGIIDNVTKTLKIDDEIDIDEVYDGTDTKANNLKYFLIKDSLSSEELNEVNANKENKEYKVCSKCGHIVLENESIDCSCGADYVVSLIEINEKKDLDPHKEKNVASNNLNHCPVCDYKSKGNGVIIGFHIGKDRATTLLAQILHRYLPEKVKTLSKTSIFGTTNIEVKEKKQFLTFSDSRQQAAFFNLFLNDTNTRFLNKAIIWNILCENNHKCIDFNTLKDTLTMKFKDDTIFNYSGDAIDANQKAWVAALWDLMLIDGKNSAEGVGLFGYRIILPKAYYDTDIEAVLKKLGYDLTTEEYRNLVQVAFEVFRVVPAIDYVEFAPADKQVALLGYRSFNNYVQKQKFPKKDDEDPKSYIRSFLPINKTNKLLKYFSKILNNENKARDFMGIIWDHAFQEKLLIDSKHDSGEDNTAKISAYSYELYSYRNVKYYKCNKCGKITIYNVRDHCIDGDCNGSLEEINPDEHFKSNYYRKEYMNRPIEQIICEEHTAQINAKDAREKQNAFKNKEINVLSCSTTFEMGINLGELTTVFMRNVPPAPANYIQRAGRAGRGKDTQAFVLTFCSASSHDYTYYRDPLSMISGIVKTPYFELDNQKIILRHILASCFSYYFAQNPSSFSSIDNFIENEHSKFWNYVNSKPMELSRYIDDYVIPKESFEKYSAFRWLEYIEDSQSSFNNMIDAIKNIINEYTIAIDNEKDSKIKEIYRSELDKLKGKNTLIKYFSKYGVIPSYGFPVDNVNLKIYNKKLNKFDDHYDLNRDLSMAISEYAPDSEIIVDGKKYTSQYLELPKNGPLTTNKLVVCDNCGMANKSLTNFSSSSTCESCNSPLKIGAKYVKNVVYPIGFITSSSPKTTRRIKPARTYAGETLYIGKGDLQAINVNVNNVVELQSFKNDILFTKNEYDFYFCSSCGYARVDKENNPLVSIRDTKNHLDHQGNKCSNLVLNKVSLGHEFKTDVVKIKFNDMDELMDKDTAISTLYALLEGIADYYIIDRDDVGGILVKSTDLLSYDFIIYDVVSGGAGNVKRIMNNQDLKAVLKSAYDKVSQECCDADTSCYNCLRNFKNQKYHVHLKRGLAKDCLKKIIEKVNNKNEKYNLINYSYSINKFSDFNSIIESIYEDSVLIEQQLMDLSHQMSLDSSVSIPDYSNVCFESLESKNKFYADFYWKNQNILLFTEYNINSYTYMKDNSVYDCYLLGNDFSLKDFIKRIRGEF